MYSFFNGYTNQNGIISFTYTCTDWGLLDFSVAQSHTQIIVDGWKQISPTSTTNYVIWQKDDNIRIKFDYASTSLTTSWTTLTSGAVSSGKRPSARVTVVGHYGNYFIQVDSYGNLQARMVSINGSTAILGQIDYTF